MGIPLPRRHKKDEQQAQLISTSGMVRRIRKDEVVLEADDHRILSYKRTDKTQFLKMGNAIKPTDLAPGDFVEIESSQDDQGYMTAVNVLWQQDGTAKDRAHAIEPVETSIVKGTHDQDTDAPEAAKAPAKAPSTPAPATAPPSAAPVEETSPADLNAPVKETVKSEQIDPDDPGAPVLKRGGQAPRGRLKLLRRRPRTSTSPLPNFPPATRLPPTNPSRPYAARSGRRKSSSRKPAKPPAASSKPCPTTIARKS